MTETTRDAERALERVIGRVLQGGVLLAAAVVLAGAVLLLVQHGATRADFSVFQSQPEFLRSFGGIAAGALRGDSRAIVQLGLVLLVATPVARVALTLLAFALQRDRIYVVVTSVVLALLVYSLFAS